MGSDALAKAFGSASLFAGKAESGGEALAAFSGPALSRAVVCVALDERFSTRLTQVRKQVLAAALADNSDPWPALVSRTFSCDPGEAPSELVAESVDKLVQTHKLNGELSAPSTLKLRGKLRNVASVVDQIAPEEDFWTPPENLSAAKRAVSDRIHCCNVKYSEPSFADGKIKRSASKRLGIPSPRATAIRPLRPGAVGARLSGNNDIRKSWPQSSGNRSKNKRRSQGPGKVNDRDLMSLGSPRKTGTSYGGRSQGNAQGGTPRIGLLSNNVEGARKGAGKGTNKGAETGADGAAEKGAEMGAEDGTENGGENGVGNGADIGNGEGIEETGEKDAEGKAKSGGNSSSSEAVTPDMRHPKYAVRTGRRIVSDLVLEESGKGPATATHPAVAAASPAPGTPRSRKVSSQAAEAELVRIPEKDKDGFKLQEMPVAEQRRMENPAYRKEKLQKLRLAKKQAEEDMRKKRKEARVERRKAKLASETRKREKGPKGDAKNGKKSSRNGKRVRSRSEKLRERYEETMFDSNSEDHEDEEVWYSDEADSDGHSSVSDGVYEATEPEEPLPKRRRRITQGVRSPNSQVHPMEAPWEAPVDEGEEVYYEEERRRTRTRKRSLHAVDSAEEEEEVDVGPDDVEWSRHAQYDNTGAHSRRMDHPALDRYRAGASNLSHDGIPYGPPGGGGRSMAGKFAQQVRGDAPQVPSGQVSNDTGPYAHLARGLAGNSRGPNDYNAHTSPSVGGGYRRASGDFGMDMPGQGHNEALNAIAGYAKASHRSLDPHWTTSRPGSGPSQPIQRRALLRPKPEEVYVSSSTPMTGEQRKLAELELSDCLDEVRHPGDSPFEIVHPGTAVWEQMLAFFAGMDCPEETLYGVGRPRREEGGHVQRHLRLTRSWNGQRRWAAVDKKI